MSDGQKQQPCPSGPGMTPLMASHKEAGAMGWLGRDRLNLCEGAGAGEGTAAPAKTARPSALPPGGPEPEVSRAAQPSVPPTEALSRTRFLDNSLLRQGSGLLQYYPQRVEATRARPDRPLYSTTLVHANR